jgi:hypothetical protein
VRQAIDDRWHRDGDVGRRLHQTGAACGKRLYISATTDVTLKKAFNRQFEVAIRPSDSLDLSNRGVGNTRGLTLSEGQVRLLCTVRGVNLGLCRSPTSTW